MADGPLNSDAGTPGSLFGWALPAGTGAPGSAGASEADTSADNAYRVPVTSPYMSVQNTDPPMVGVGLDDTAEPGQGREGISGISTMTTGAGQGHTTSRHPNSPERPA